MNKLTILTGNTAWGMYNFRRVLIEKLISLGINVVVVAPEDSTYTSLIESLGAKFIPIKISSKGANVFADLKLVFDYCCIFKRLKPDFICFYTIKPNIFGSIAAQMFKIPHIVIVTGLGYTFVNKNIISTIAKKLYKFAFRNVHNVWFLNQDDKRVFLNERLVDSKKIKVINGEGIDITRFTVSEMPTETSIILIARMLWDKGIGEFIEAAKILKQRYKNVSFNLLGGASIDNPSAISSSQLEMWNAEGFVKYLGFTNNVIDFISKSTCVVLPSYREGIPFSLLEASACGKPIVTTNVAGCRDVIVDGLTGYICESKDVASLVNSIEKIILMDREELVSMGLEGRKKIVRDFSSEKIIQEYVNVLIKYNIVSGDE